MFSCVRGLECCGVSGSLRLRSCRGGTRWYSLGVRSKKGVLALTGVGKTFAGAEENAEIADSLF